MARPPSPASLSLSPSLLAAIDVCICPCFISTTSIAHATLACSMHIAQEGLAPLDRKLHFSQHHKRRTSDLPRPSGGLGLKCILGALPKRVCVPRRGEPCVPGRDWQSLFVSSQVQRPASRDAPLCRSDSSFRQEHTFASRPRFASSMTAQL